MKTRMLVILCLALTLALGSTIVGAKQTAIGLAVSTLNNPFFVDLRDGAVAEGKTLGYNVVVADGQNDANKQLSQIENFIQQKVDLIVVNPVDSDAVAAAVKAANKAGIPVITVDRGANGGNVVCHIASDNVAGGRMAGEYIAKIIGGSGNVIELEGIPGTSAARDRGQGFNDAMKDFPKIKVVARQEAGFDRAKGMSVMENLLQANPNVSAVFAHNDEMALGAMKAIEAAGKAGKIKVVGFDATDDAVKAVKEGKMAATVAQKPTEMGKIAIATAKDVLAGKTVAKFVPVSLALVTK